ncbi:uncharacterized protein LOC110684209 [Chenopodium quinoa]|uniref:uncharacterized protein LOC110684209 n=1 Tax=Chenopodium quinoa TaxID=63459 RepID=UPI000B7955E4|nr:uncharacterized protein LOC110684209 [Chenopodium quinoa]
MGGETWWIVHRESGRRDQAFKLPNPALTKFEKEKPSYTFELDGQGEAQEPHHSPPPHPSPQYHPPPQPYTYDIPTSSVDYNIDPHAPYDFPAFRSQLDRIERGQGRVEGMVQNLDSRVGTLDRRVGHVERNLGRGLYPMYDDYARQRAIPPETLVLDWFQYPPGGYSTPGAYGTYVDYSSVHGYGVDAPFGGMGGKVYPNYFAGGSGYGDAGTSHGGADLSYGGGYQRMDENDDEE